METRFRVSRKALEKEARKQDILDAAARLFSQRDFHEVTVDQIAAEVGLSKGTVYLYFRNKDDLFHAIVVQKGQSLLRKTRESLQCAGDFVDCLREFVRAHCGFFEENVTYFRITHSEKTRMTAEGKHRLHDYADQLFHAHLAMLMELVERGRSEGVLREEGSLALVKALRGILTAYVFHYAFGQSETPLSEQAEEIVDLFLNGAKRQAP
ncbi:TetR/AcrR family transcriptional regulator [Candidatus Fermentibacteria bacterium]|nr:TetR/AcrR family transcriptional regulator [Candidatus Fermentibacteria bacterium]